MFDWPPPKTSTHYAGYHKRLFRASLPSKMRAEYVGMELETARKELEAVAHAIRDVLVASHNLGTPIVDEQWMQFDNFFDGIYEYIDELQQICFDYAKLGKRINRCKHQLQDEWAETRAAATQGMGAAGADGGATGVHVAGGASDGSTSETSNTGTAGRSGPETVEHASCTPDCAYCREASLFNNLCLTADNIDSGTVGVMRIKARIESKLAPPKLFPQFSKMPVELQIMIWEAAVQPPRCKHILDAFKDPRTNDDVAEALKLSPDAGLWKASPLSLRTVLRAYNKEKARYLITNENGELPPCLYGTLSKADRRRAEAMYRHYVDLPRHVKHLREGLEDFQALLEELLRWVKLGVTKAREKLWPVVPYADEFLAAFGPILHPEWEAHHCIPLLRIQKMAANMCSETTPEPTYSDDELRQFDEQYGVPADMSLLQQLAGQEEAALDLPPEIWNDGDPDAVPTSMSGW